jgi:hypothetical protein
MSAILHRRYVGQKKAVVGWNVNENLVLGGSHAVVTIEDPTPSRTPAMAKVIE